MAASPSLVRAYQVLAKPSQWMKGFINDHDFFDLLLAVELALVRGQIGPKLIAGRCRYRERSVNQLREKAMGPDVNRLGNWFFNVCRFEK